MPLFAMHKYAHFWKSSRRWRPQFPFLFYFFALVSEQPSPQYMCNVCTIRQHISSSRDGTGPEPLTQPDPTRTLFDAVTRPVTECLCFELRDYFDDGVLQVNAFCQKSGLCTTHTHTHTHIHTHTQMTKISNIIVSLFSTEK